MEPTYYRHRNDDLRHEIVAHAFVPGEGARWSVTVTDDEGGFEQQIAVHVRTDQLAAYAEFPQLFAALAERKPGTLDEVAGLLDALGVVDETADRERRRAQSATAWRPEDDAWPHL